MKYKLSVIVFCFLVSNVLHAKEWTGAYYSSTLKASALKNEKSNPAKAVEQYMDLSMFYTKQNSDSVRYFADKAVGLALLSNDINLIVSAWVHKSGLYKRQKENPAIYSARKALDKNSSDLLVLLVTIIERKGDFNAELLNEVDSVLLANEPKMAKASETERLVYALLLYERAAIAFASDVDIKYNANIDLCPQIFLEKGMMTHYNFSLTYKARVLFIKGKQAEGLKLDYQIISQAKQLDNIVLYLNALTSFSYDAIQANLYNEAENAASEVLSISLSPKIRATRIGAYKLTEVLNILYRINYKNGKIDKAIYYIQKCIDYSDSLCKFRNPQDSLSSLDARFNLADLYASTKRYEAAILIFLKLLENKMVMDDPVFYAQITLNMGTCYVGYGQYQKGLEYLNKSQPVVEELLGWFEKKSLYAYKRDAFVELKNLDSAIYYYNKYGEAKDSLFNSDTKAALLDVQEKYKTDILKAENNSLIAEKEANQLKDWLYWSIIGFCLILGAMGLYAYKNQARLKEKQEQLFKAEKENLANQLLAKEVQESKYKVELELKEAKEQEILSQLEFKSRETTSMATVALQNANLIAEIQNLIKGINGNEEENNRIIKEVNNLVGNQKHLEAFWNSFRRYFQETHPRFFAVLEERHPKLTQNDHKVCSFLVLGMSNNEISLLQNIEPRSFLRTRQRLKEKMGLEASVELEVYLNSLLNVK